jgi:hypothetical protein
MPVRFNTPLAFFLILTAAACVFNSLPTVEAARVYVSQLAQNNANCGCTCILEMRPWYGRINIFWPLWIALLPLLVFSCTPLTSSLQRTMRSFSVILVGIILFILQDYTRDVISDIRFIENDPILVKRMSHGCSYNNLPENYTLHPYIILLAVLWSTIYFSLLEMIWRIYHRFITKLLAKSFRHDFISTLSFIFLTIFLSFIAVMGLIGSIFN